MKRSIILRSLICFVLSGAAGSIGLASTAEMYFPYDKDGQDRVTDIQKGESVWIVVYDPDENEFRGRIP